MIRKLSAVTIFLCFLFQCSSGFEERAGRRSKENRVISGWDSKHYPFYALIDIDNGAFLCGATLIHPKILATAAHCFADRPSCKITARFLDSDVIYNVGERVFMDSFSYVTAVDDIALLKLVEKAETDRVLWLCDHSGFGKHLLSVIGLGATGYNGTYENGDVIETFPDLLQETYMEEVHCAVVRDQNAEFRGTPLADYMAKDTTQICLQGAHGSESACNGDSGGPLFPLDDAKKPMCLYGIMSYMPGGYAQDNWACSYGLSVYTRVPAYMEWINRNGLKLLHEKA